VRRLDFVAANVRDAMPPPRARSGGTPAPAAASQARARDPTQQK
jgi:hypothetical protein